MKKRRKRNRRLDPRKLDPGLAESLRERITPPRPPKPKVSFEFATRTLAYLASQNMKAFKGWIIIAVETDNKLFFDLMVKFQKKKPIRLPISEDEREVLVLYAQNPHLSASDALDLLGWKGIGKDPKGKYYNVKKRALERLQMMKQVLHDGWLKV